jgi:hypothetical protein
MQRPNPGRKPGPGQFPLCGARLCRPDQPQHTRVMKRIRIFHPASSWRSCCDRLSAQSRSAGGARLCEPQRERLQTKLLRVTDPRSERKPRPCPIKS